MDDFTSETYGETELCVNPLFMLLLYIGSILKRYKDRFGLNGSIKDHYGKASVILIWAYTLPENKK